jgi:sugar/nucleoside kinase (ribokinase family)
LRDSPEVLDVFLPASGRVFLDFIFSGLPRVPTAGEEIYARRFDSMIGGAYNAARALHRLEVGAHLAADLGPDVPSRIVRDLWDAEGLPTTFRRDVSTPTAAITCSYSLDHDRGFLSFIDPLPPPWNDPAIFDAYRVRRILLTGVPRDDSFIPLLERARALAIPVDMDSSFVERRLSEPSFRRHLQLVDTYFCNEVEARLFTECAELDDAARGFLEFAPVVVIKTGPGGATFYRRGEKVVQAAPSIEVMDTTGAGDCFVGGYAAGRVGGLDEIGSLRLAVAVGSLTCAGIGGAAAPRREAAEELAARLPQPVFAPF